MTSITTRPARTSDLPAIRQMIHVLAAFHGDTATVTLSQLQDIFFDTPKGRAFVALNGSRMVGYAGVLETVNVQFAKPHFDIDHLFVVEDMRAKGVGKALISAAKDYAQGRGAAGITIGTNPDNTAAQASYRAMGLAEISGAGPRFWIPVA